MRRAFRIGVQSPRGLGEFWKELGWSDAFRLPLFFDIILFRKIAELSDRDGHKGALSPEQFVAYNKEASDMMYSLRDYPPLNKTLPVVTGLGAPNFIRLGQSPNDADKGLLGYHFAVLWDAAGKQVLGLSTLEKTKNPNEAEITAFMHPDLHRSVVYGGLVAFMSWAQKNAGYRHFTAHTQARTNSQHGNPRALHAAIYLGFRFAGRRGADDPNGNGYETLILKAPNWSPPKKYAEFVS